MRRKNTQTGPESGAPHQFKGDGKLDEHAWVEAALDQLAVHGIDGVRVELLAKQLNVTKGSFYWHFRDRDDLRERMLAHWRRRATLLLIERLDRDESSPRQRLTKLLRLPIEGRRSAQAADVELALRLWGRHDARAQDALDEVDRLRLRYIAGLLVECGCEAQHAQARAVLAYSYMRVAASLVPPDAHDLMASCEEILLGNKS